MPIVETRILDIDLPQFLLDFRDISLSWVLSPLQKGITIVNELNDENHKSTVSFLL